MYIKEYYVYLKLGGSRICGYTENILVLRCYVLKCSWVKFMMFITCSNYSEKKCMIDSWRERERERTKPNWQTVGKSRSRIYRCSWSTFFFFSTFLKLESVWVLFLSGRLVQEKKKRTFLCTSLVTSLRNAQHLIPRKLPQAHTQIIRLPALPTRSSSPEMLEEVEGQWDGQNGSRIRNRIFSFQFCTNQNREKLPFPSPKAYNIRHIGRGTLLDSNLESSGPLPTEEQIWFGFKLSINTFFFFRNHTEPAKD